MSTLQHPLNLSSVPALYSFQPQEPGNLTQKTTRFVRSDNRMSNLKAANTHKVVITRDIGEKAMTILEQDRPDLKIHVCYSCFFLAQKCSNSMQLQIWSEPRPVDRKWLLHNVDGATGLLVMVSDKASVEHANINRSLLKNLSDRRRTSGSRYVFSGILSCSVNLPSLSWTVS